MIELTRYELMKQWGRRPFLLVSAGLLLLSVILTLITGGGRLGAYRLYLSRVRGMDADAQAVYIASLLSLYPDPDSLLPPGEGATGPDVTFTGDVYADISFLRTLAEECGKVRGYADYLTGIGERRDELAAVSVFGGNYALRAMDRSLRDHSGLTADNISWFPAYPVVNASESVWTDLCLILLGLLFTGGLVTGEKELGTLPLIRASRRGGTLEAFSKLLALLIHSLVSSAMLFVANILVFRLLSGPWPLTARIQSIAPYMESAVDINLLQYLLLSPVAKGGALFAGLTVTAALCLTSKRVTAPYIWGLAVWVLGWAAYSLVPAGSKMSFLRCLSVFAGLRTGELFGSYLNLELFGAPVSRQSLTWGFAGALGTIGCASFAVLWTGTESIEAHRGNPLLRLSFRPHGLLLRHEAYKLLVAQRGLAVLALTAALVALAGSAREYYVGSGERYYMDMMLRLQGPETEASQELIDSETQRFKDAFDAIDRINARVASGELTDSEGDALKYDLSPVTSLYPHFQRVLERREIAESGGEYVYDTGWLYLLGVRGDVQLTDYLILTAGTVLALSASASREFTCGAWPLIVSSRRGSRAVMCRKLAVCVISAFLLWAVPFAVRLVSVAGVYPLPCPGSAVRNVPDAAALPGWLPLWAAALVKLLTQTLSGAITAAAVLGLSRWRRSQTQTVIIGLALLAGPCLLQAAGVSWAGALSTYRLFIWSP